MLQIKDSAGRRGGKWWVVCVYVGIKDIIQEEEGLGSGSGRRIKKIQLLEMWMMKLEVNNSEDFWGFGPFPVSNGEWPPPAERNYLMYNKQLSREDRRTKSRKGLTRDDT